MYRALASVFILLLFSMLSSAKADDCEVSLEKAIESCSKNLPSSYLDRQNNESAYLYAYRSAYKVYSEVGAIHQECSSLVSECATSCFRAAHVGEAMSGLSPYTLKMREYESECKEGGVVFEKHKAIVQTQKETEVLVLQAEANYLATRSETDQLRTPAALLSVPSIPQNLQIERALQHIK